MVIDHRQKKCLESGRVVFFFLLSSLLAISTTNADESALGKHGYAQSGDVKIHYVTKGEGPLLVMIHGFPDYWYTWREQIPALSEHFQVVAMDQRGYNLSGKPEGLARYQMEELVQDVEAVIKHFGKKKAIVVGHDWGGAVAWSFATAKPQMIDHLVILNLPHFNGLQRELANNPEQRRASAYAREFQKEDAASRLTAEGLTFWIKDSEAKAKYLEAFKRSSLEGMLNYYKANYPRPPYDETPEMPPVDCSVLMIHGLKDTALLPGALNDTWKWVKRDLTLVTLPEAGHFVQQDAGPKVTQTLLTWLRMKGLDEGSKN
ncbi:MAG: alpha/beta hydrolase [Planctomycetota bacterium]|jgi:pimeloyl-ACP methyl ester carboxylesterase|nr:alpha/beta hydrolase [Planctomycetota bacterium]